MSRFEIKIVAALLLIAVIPLGASVYLVGQVIKVSDSVTEGQTQRLARPLERAADAYRDLFAVRKQMFRLQGQLLALDPRLLGEPHAPAGDAQLSNLLGQIARAQRDVGRIELLRGGRVVASGAGRPYSEAAHRHLRLEFPLGSTLRAPAGAPHSPLQSGSFALRAPTGAPFTSGGAQALHSLRVTFFTPRQPFEDFRHLGLAQRTTVAMARLRDELATYYRVVFLIIFGAVALVATGLGLFIARRTTRRVAVLAQATRKVAAGDLETRVHLRTRDELGDLASSFNEMVQRIKESGERIAYLEKVGAWQEIARRLAHEIKNPLTPIQLAVQQLHRKYRGEDPEFTRTLEDAHDIITEEVDGLRRLVQAFSAFAKLPSVQPSPVELELLVDDFLKSHSELSEQAHIEWSPDPSVARQAVLVDRMLIKHVLFNLVENAIHAAQEAGSLDRLSVVLQARVAGRSVMLTVEDNGPGMDPETTRRVFDPYFTTKERGTGLGLAIVKKIVLEHRGFIVVDSRPGGGTRFTLSLPLARDETPIPSRRA